MQILFHFHKEESILSEQPNTYLKGIPNEMWETISAIFCNFPIKPVCFRGWTKDLASKRKGVGYVRLELDNLSKRVFV